MLLRLFALALVTLVVGCASTHMQQYLGKDIREVILDSGPPISVVDMGDGMRAFQFRWGGGAYVAPKTTSLTGTVTSAGNSAWFQGQAMTSGGGVYVSDGCVVTYLATYDQSRNAWIVMSLRAPKALVC